MPLPRIECVVWGVVEWRRVSAVDSFAHWIRPDPLSDGKAPSVSVQEVHQSAPGAVDSEGDAKRAAQVETRVSSGKPPA
jgi:hypothetical protein